MDYNSYDGRNIKTLIEKGEIPKSIDFKDIKEKEGIYFKNKELQLLGLGSISGNRQIAILRGVR